MVLWVYFETLHPPTYVSFFSFSSVPDLPASPVDLVINCLDCHENRLLREQSWYQSAADWANQNRAPVLSIDPAVSEQHQTVEAKWTLSLGLPLPLAKAESRVYLCDIGIPKMVFQEVGIRYHSPFGCKFVIPLHSAEHSTHWQRTLLQLDNRKGLVCFSTVGKGTFVYVAIAEEQLHDQNNILLQSVYNFLTCLKAHGVGFSSCPLEAPRVRCVLRATPLVFERKRFPVLQRVLIRALWRCEYVYKMLTTVSLSMTSDPVTRQSSRETVPVSSFRLHVESDPDPVTRSTAQPKAVCQPKSAIHLPHSWCPCLLSFNLMQFFLLTQMGVLTSNGCGMFHWKGEITQNLYLYLFLEYVSGIMNEKCHYCIYIIPDSTLSALLGVLSL